MKEPNFRVAIKQANKLAKKYGNMKNIIFDDWRGWRFIFDTAEVLKCDNNCRDCQLYKFLKREGRSFKFVRLRKASERDQKMFGPQKFLDCKTLKEYQKCYINFLLKETKTKPEIERELALLMNMKIGYSKSGPVAEIERKFKQTVLRAVLVKSGRKKKGIINNYLDTRAVN